MKWCSGVRRLVGSRLCWFLVVVVLLVRVCSSVLVLVVLNVFNFCVCSVVIMLVSRFFMFLMVMLGLLVVIICGWVCGVVISVLVFFSIIMVW